MTGSKRRIPINNHGSAAQAPGESAPLENAGAEADEEQATDPRVSKPRDKKAGAQDQPAAQESPAAQDQPTAQAPLVADLEAGDAVLLEAEVALKEAVEERDAFAESLLRLRAEFENFRKRAARELTQARERAQGELLGELLPVLDNLERALDAAEHHEEGKVLAGVRMTRDMFVDLLRRKGVEEIETLGAEFDPAVHEAVLLQPSDSEEGIVTVVLERGYRQGEQVLRPARVAVSSGPGAPDGPATAG